MPPCTYPTLIVGRLSTYALPVTTSSAVIFSKLHNTFAPTLTNCPLLRLRTQATSYIPSHLHLANDHTYTPYDERYCPSCLPIKIVGNELHTLLHCPHSSSLSHPAILGLTRSLRRYDLYSWSSHTPLQQTVIFFWSAPPKLLHKHDKAWTHSTSTTCTQLIYSLQSHCFKHQPSASPGPVPSLTSSATSAPSDDTQCQVCQSLCDEEKLLLSDICNAGWHMDCLLLTLTSWDMEMSLVYHSCPIMPGSTATLRFPSPILDPDSE